MGKAYKVNAACLRYIVPFKYSESFEEACKKIEEQKEEICERKNKEKKSAGFQKIWERKTSTIDGPESDIYGYIKNEFRFENDTEELTEKKSGCEWLFWRSEESKAKEDNKGIIKKLWYYPEEISKECVEPPSRLLVNISNMGLLLFRNGLGFIWYEMRIKKKGIDSNQLKQFQNSIRELNRKILLWEDKGGKEPAQGVMILRRNRDRNDRSKFTEIKTYIEPFAIGMWIRELLGFLTINYLAKREATYNSMIKKTMANLKGLDNDVYKVVGAEGQFVKDDDALAPDKAILFTYASFDTEGCEDSLKDRQTLTYHLTNGYRDSYHLSEEVSSEMKRPFEDVLWYATQEGAAYLSWHGKDNKEFFTTTILSKITADYFTLYLKTLYQSFSLLIYAEKIQDEILAVKGKYLTESFDSNIMELFGEINLFLAKSMATSVSYIHHQSEFYVYLKNQLRVHDDVKSVTSGLNALDMLQREQRQRKEEQEKLRAWEEEKERERQEQKAREEREEREKRAEKEEEERDKKTQNMLGWLSVLAIGSAFVDAFDFIAKFDPNAENGWNALYRPVFVVEVITIAIITVVSVYIIVSVVRNICKKTKKEKGSDNDEV